MNRTCGILLPVFSLPSKHGIGAFSEEAYDFVDFLQEAGQSYWQILPLGPTSFGDSPYQSFSTYAGNPYFIDLDTLAKEGLLRPEEIAAKDPKGSKDQINYEGLYHARKELLHLAYQRSLQSTLPGAAKQRRQLQQFCKEQAFWLEDYALFMAIKEHFSGASWDVWDEDIRLRKEGALRRYRRLCREEIRYQKFVQYHFFQQWNTLKQYANAKGIRIIGDLPIYVAYDSADTWSQPDLFQLEWSGQPDAVAGCPPDAYAKTGQLWGNPLYRWNYHKQTEFSWWISRLRFSLQLYDVVRIDHFRGFEAYYSIPFQDPTAEFGHWEKGPGYALFAAAQKALPALSDGTLRLIAEDLGFLTPGVHRLLKRCGFPGMKVLQFAFDASGESDYLSYHYDRNCIVYTGTHDNMTSLEYLTSLSPKDRRFLYDYLGIPRKTKAQDITNVDMLVKEALRSVADTAIIPMQDYLHLGKEARINTPSTLGNNWKWRMKKTALKKPLAGKIRKTCALYGRVADASKLQNPAQGEVTYHTAVRKRKKGKEQSR